MKIPIFLLFLLFLNQNEDFKFAMGLFNDGMYKLSREEFLSFAQNNPESELAPDSKYFAAECLFREKQYKDAIQEFKIVKRLYPKFVVKANMRIGVSYYNLGIVDSGIIVFKEIKAQKPDEANYWIGEGYFKLKDYKKAIKFYKLVEKGKYQQYALYSIGFSALELKDFKQALSSLNKVTEDKLKPQAEFLLAKTYYEKKDYKEAISRLKKIKGKYEKEANFLLGEIFYTLSKFEQAIQFYTKCKTPLGMTGLGKTYYVLKKYDKSLKVYKELINYPKYRNNAIEWLGRIYYDQKLYDQAIKWLDKINTYEAKLMSANAYFEKGNYEEAILRYERLYDETKKPEPLYRIALSFYKIKKYDEAKEVLTDYSGEEIKMSLLLGEITYDEKKYNEALKHYKSASKSATTEKKGLKGMIACFLVLKNSQKAYETSKLLVEKYPDKDTYYEFANVAYINKKYPEAVKFYSLCGKSYALFQVGNIYYEIGEYEKSIQGFEKFLNSYPLHTEADKAKYLIGLACRKQGKFSESSQALTELTKLYPGTKFSFDAKCTIGDNFYDEGKYKEAEAAYREALELLKQKYDEKALRPIYGILDSKLELEGLTNALEIAKAYIERLKENPIVDRLRTKVGAMCYNEAKLELAIEYYAQIENKHLKPSASYSIANCYKKLNKLEETIKSLEAIVNDFPNSKFAPIALYDLGKIYYQKKEYEKSKELLNTVLKEYSKCEQIGAARLQLACIYVKLENLEDSENQLKIILNVEKNPEIIAKARLELGKLFLHQEKSEEAINELKLVLESKIIEILPEARYELGEAHFGLKDYKLALTTYLKVKYLYSENKFITPALYKAALCNELLSKKEEAQRFYQMVIKRKDNPDLISKSKQALEKLKSTP
ncbi:tetratricopeptide repeat protein [candidate division WOR-3 bacterium]|nr:tetratricopeptide repeat protein [candidate division WOR-3 bacterium]